MKIVGLNEGHGSSAILLNDGRLVAGIQEERFTRVKNQGGFPQKSIEYLLSIDSSDEEVVVASCGTEVPPRDRTRNDTLHRYEAGFSMGQAIKGKVRELPRIGRAIDRIVLRHKRNAERFTDAANFGFATSLVNTIDHHTCHAAAAYYGWGKYDEPVVVVTCDGAGDRLCATVSIGKRGHLERIADISEENSVGLLYSRITYLMGMVPLEHEYKLMGLAPYAGFSSGVKTMRDRFSSLFEFDEKNPLVWKRKRGVPSMYYALPLLKKIVEFKRFDHVAAGLQLFLEEFLVTWIRNIVRETGIRKLAFSGGVFMNVKANKAIMEMPEVENIFIYPSCGDETNAAGAAYYLQANQNSKLGEVISVEPLSHLYWGTEHTDKEVEQALLDTKTDHQLVWEYKENIEKDVARLLADGEVVARYKGRMEFGARSLGNRSILANPSKPGVIKIINDMIKSRDFWMPFAASLIAEDSNKYIVNAKKIPAPYMILSFDTKPEARDAMRAGIHPYDYTCRAQEVYEEWNRDYHKLICHFREFTGESVILNTSFNLHGYPVVETPAQAIEVLDRSGLESLAIGNYLVRKRK